MAARVQQSPWEVKRSIKIRIRCQGTPVLFLPCGRDSKPSTFDVDPVPTEDSDGGSGRQGPAGARPDSRGHRRPPGTSASGPGWPDAAADVCPACAHTSAPREALPWDDP